MGRRILIVDDNELNREILKNLLSTDYEILEAENGKVALDILTENYDSISAVTLDLIMPELDGYQVLEAMQKSPNLSLIPVIVTTGDKENSTEMRALSLGANDFALKPYNAQILKKRIANMIKLRETAAVVNAERIDALTGLYTRGAFFEKVSELVSAHESGFYVFAFFNIEKFKIINDQYGVKKGDQVLKHVASVFQSDFSKIGAVFSRFNADNFAVLYPKSFENSQEIEAIRYKTSYSNDLQIKLNFYIGRYIVDDVSLSPSAMCDRAVLAARSIRGRFDKQIAYYDENMRSQLLKEQAITAEMNTALEQQQFEIWFQPQYNHSTGALVGAEALVRWRHPQKGLVSPGDFIPVFEKNGFIYELDKFVWRRTCQYLHDWIAEGRTPLPVSVNISRFDILNDDLVDVICGYVQEFSLSVSLLRLEVTESAFVQSEKRIISVVEQFVSKGFTVEIDDFGSGYSSLNTLKNVPAQIIKLDMKFLQGSENVDRGGSIIESIVRMSKWLGMSVIAEGVEKTEQADYLLSIGCCYIQGYLYAKPMPASEYEQVAQKVIKEEHLLTIETVENYNNNSFWNSAAIESIIFNSYVGAACIFEYHDGSIELLRANKKYAQLFGDRAAVVPIADILKCKFEDYFDAQSKYRIKEAVLRSSETHEDVVLELALNNFPYSAKTVYLRVMFCVIAVSGSRYLVYCTNENISQRVEAERNEKRMIAQLNLIMDNVNCGISIKEKSKLNTGSFLLANNQRFEMFGFTRAQAKSKAMNMYEPICEEDRASVQAAIAECFETNKNKSYDFRGFKQDGQMRYFLANSTPITLPDKKEPILLSVITDVTERKKAANRISDLNTELQSMMSDAPGGYGRLCIKPDGSHEILYVNDTLCALFGYTRKEVMELYKNDITQIVHEDDKERLIVGIQNTIKGQISENKRYRIRAKSGDYIWFELFVRCTKDSNGNFFLNAYFNNISEDEKKRISFAEMMPMLLKSLMHTSPNLDFAKDKNFVYVFCSKPFAIFAGQEDEAGVIGKTDFELFDYDIAKKFREDDERLFAEGNNIINILEEISSDDDKLRYSNTSKYILRDSFGNIVGLYGTGIDVTQSVSSSSQLQVLSDSIPGGVATLVITPTSRMHASMRYSVNITYFNNGFIDLLGLTHIEYTEILKEHGVFSIVFEEDIPSVIEQIQQFVEFDVPINCVFRIHCKDEASTKWVTMQASQYEKKGDSFISNIVLYDVSKNKFAEQKLIKAHKKLKIAIQLLDDSSSAVYVCDANTHQLLYINKTCAKICGSTVENGLGKPCYEFLRCNDRPCNPCFMNASHSEQFTEQEYFSKPSGKYYTMRGKYLTWGGRLAFVVYLSDETAIAKANRNLQCMTRGLEIVAANSKCCFWKFNLDENRLTWDSFKHTNFMKYPLEMRNLPDSMIFDGYVHQDDVAEFTRMYDDLFHGAERTECTVRLRSLVDNQFEWYHQEYARIHDDYTSSRQAVGFAMNVNNQIEDRRRYDHILELWSSLMKKSIVYYEMNITKHTILDYKSRLNEEPVMHACDVISPQMHERILANIEKRFQEKVKNTLFSQALARLYQRGQSNVELEYKRNVNGVMHFVKAISVLTKQPVTGELLAFVSISDIDLNKTNEMVLNAIAEENLDIGLVLAVKTKRARFVKNLVTLSDYTSEKEFDYAEKIAEIINSYVMPEDQLMCSDYLSQEHLAAALKIQQRKTLMFKSFGNDGIILYKRLTAYYLDEEQDRIVIICRDITELYKEEQAQKDALQKAVALANDANNAKSDFLSRMSHDMRTPMNAIMGLVKLSKDEEDIAQIKEYLSDIDSSSNYLLGLINDILDLSKIESKRIHLHEELYDIDEFSKDCKTLFQPLADEKNIHLIIDLNRLHRYIMVDKLRYTQIFYNLLSNAVKYTSSGGRILFTSKPLPCEELGKIGVQYKIEDTGCGMSKSFLRILFEPFAQEKNESTSELQGSGLGLAITKNLVEVMGGTINVTSTQGKGTQFTVDLYVPLGDKKKQKEISTSIDYTKLENMQVLLTEDNHLNTLIETKMLEKHGCIVTCAKNGEVAVSLFASSPEHFFDVILMDVRMPIMNGLDATQKIRALDRADAKTVPIIAMTADSFPEEKEKMFAAGMNAHVAKPVNPEMLFSTILDLIGGEAHDSQE